MLKISKTFSFNLLLYSNELLIITHSFNLYENNHNIDTETVKSFDTIAITNGFAK